MIVVPQRNPWLLARQLATIDVFNGGRTILGAGIGWLREEFEALKMPFDHRIARTDEAIELMRTIWTEHPVHFQGAFFERRADGRPAASGAAADSDLARRQFGGGDRTGGAARERLGSLRTAAGGARPGLGRRARVPPRRRGAIRLGITCSLWAPITITRRGAPPGPEGLYLHGEADPAVDRLTEYAKAGLQHFLMFNFCAPEETAEQVERIATEVLPHVKGLSARRPAERAGGAMGEAVIRERIGAVERLWLNRPEVENQLNDAIYDALSRALREISVDPAGRRRHHHGQGRRLLAQRRRRRDRPQVLHEPRGLSRLPAARARPPYRDPVGSRSRSSPR